MVVQLHHRPPESCLCSYSHITCGEEERGGGFHHAEHEIDCSTRAISHDLPHQVLNQHVPIFTMRGDQVETAKDRKNLLSFALEQNDKDRFNFILETDIYFRARSTPQGEQDESDRFYSLPVSDFNLAVRLGRTDILSDVIARFGAGIPLEHLVKKSGVEMKTKPKYKKIGRTSFPLSSSLTWTIWSLLLARVPSLPLNNPSPPASVFL